MEESVISFGSWLRRRRKALDLTQDALADLVGCSKDLITKIEGEARRPSREIAALLATHLQIAAEERDDFIRCARAELAADRLPSPTARVPRPVLVRATTVVASPRHNLPLQISSFLGREHEIGELVALIHQPNRRLITLTGPGGTGKTRLALAVATTVAAEYPDGVWFVDLAPIRDPQQAASATMQALGVRELPDRTPQERLAQWLALKQLLLVLDNFEQILDAAPLVVALLQAAPQLSILVTSRVPLRLRGEQEYPVLPLGLPPTSLGVHAQIGTGGSAVGSVDDFTQYEAVRLFIERARAVRPEFQVTDTTAPAIAEICQQLDGLPLAIELAAARIRMFPPEVLLTRLQAAKLPTLSGGARDLPARQQTIQAAIDWSYQLLTPAQQRLFARLGVFVGGWTLEAAEAVCVEDGLDVVAELQALVEQSLVRVIETGSEPRYTMLETVREFANNQLLHLQLQRKTRHQLLMYLVALMEQMQGSYPYEEWDDRAIEERDNCVMAFHWCLSSEWDDGQPLELGLRLAKALWIYWFALAPSTGARILSQMLDHTDSRRFPVLRARLLSALGHLFLKCGDPERAMERLTGSLEESLSLEEHRWLSEIYRHIGEIHLVREEFAQANERLEQSLTFALELQNQWDLAWTRYDLARVAVGRGDWALVRAHYYASETAFRIIDGAKNNIIFTARNLAIQAIAAGEYPFASELLAGARSEVDNHREAMFVYRELTLLALKQHNLELGRRHLREAFRLLGMLPPWPEEAYKVAQLVDLLLYAAVVGITHSAHSRIVALLSFIAEEQRQIGLPQIDRIRQELHANTQDHCRATLGDAAFEAAWAVGRALTLDAAIAEALALTADPAPTG